MVNIVILGPQGSGKSTQAKLLAKHLKLPFLDIGDLLREETKKQTERAKVVAELINHGSLVNVGLLTELLKEELADPKYKKGVILDGAPRTLAQAKMMDKILPVDKVIYISVSDKVAQGRLLDRGRSDDTPELIDKRLRIYHTLSEPVLAYYETLGILEKVDGEGSVDEIFEDIRSRQ